MKNHLHCTEKQNLYTICSGSLGEGVAYPTSDDDVMSCPTNQRVVMTYREATQRDVLMVPSEYSPGYCLLLDVNESKLHILIQIIDEMPFLSSSLFKHSCLPEDRRFTQIHGPCLSEKVDYGEYDHAFCISCSTWPDVAKEWLTRNRSYNWPSCEMIQNIVGHGCHVVPVGDPDSPHCEHEWRISFSLAERTLMHSFNHVQFLVYNLLRLTLKRIIGKKFSNVICSYFMKTILFFTAEKTPIELWHGRNLEARLKTCVSVLYDYVDSIYCPNYFVPEYNMIKRKINHTNRHGMLDIIRTIHNIGIVGILYLSGELHCLNDTLSATDVECKLDREFIFDSLPNEAAVPYTYFLSSFLRMLRKCTQNELSIMMWYRATNSYCLRLMHCFFNFSRKNKHGYLLHKNLRPMLTIGLKGDVTTIKLTMATYMYIVGKTKSAICVIQRLLSDYPPYAIDGSEDELKSEIYFDAICGRGYSIDYKARRAYVPYYNPNIICLNAFPHPMKIWISIMNSICVNPLLYAYFLQSLCYVKLRKPFLLKISRRCLIDYIHEMEYADQRAYAKMYVCIIKYVQGDTQSACRWLGSLYLIAYDLHPPLNGTLARSVLFHFVMFVKQPFSVLRSYKLKSQR